MADADRRSSDAPMSAISEYKQTSLPSTKTDTEEMKRKLTERMAALRAKKTNRQQEDSAREWAAEPLTGAAGGDEGLGGAGTTLQTTDQAARRPAKRTPEYSRLSPFQRRQRKQQELNSVLEQFRSDVSEMAQRKFSPY